MKILSVLASSWSEIWTALIRPIDPEERAAVRQVHDRLPEEIRTAPNQVLGHASAGCSATYGVMERCNRTLREAIEEHDLVGRYDSERVIDELVTHYNQVRLHSALMFQTPATWYRGNPDTVSETRRRKLAQARHRRKQINLGIRQTLLPFSASESATSN